MLGLADSERLGDTLEERDGLKDKLIDGDAEGEIDSLVAADSFTATPIAKASSAVCVQPKVILVEELESFV